MNGKCFPIHPGEILLHEFMEPMGITRYRLSLEEELERIQPLARKAA